MLQALLHEEIFFFYKIIIWGKDHYQGDHPPSERDGGEREVKDGSGKLQKGGRHPQFKTFLSVYSLVFFFCYF